MQNISFTVDKQKLVGTLQYPEIVKEQNPAILFIHGWKSSQRRNIERAKLLVEAGFICMTFSLRGHGDSEGDRGVLSREDYLNDVIAAYDFFIKQPNVNSEKIGLIGASFGGYLAVLLTGRRDVEWLVLQAPANYPDEGFSEPKPDDSSLLNEWRSKAHNVSDVLSLQAMKNYKNETLIIESENDSWVPVKTVHNYRDVIDDPNNLTYFLLKDADHGLRIESTHVEYLNILTRWFSSKI